MASLRAWLLREHAQRECFYRGMLALDGFADLDQLQAWARAGVPPELRPRVWRQLLHLRGMPHDSQHYNYLTAKMPTAMVREEIDKDLHRTFPENLTACSPARLKIQQRVLAAFGVHDSALAYCQGMNFICGFLLVVLDNEEDSFWCLAAMVQQLLPGYFASDLHGSVVDLRVFEDMVTEGCPEIAAKLKELEFDMELVSAQWLTTAFVSTHPAEFVARAWDQIFCDGADALLRLCLRFLAVNSQLIFEADDGYELAYELKQAAMVCYDCTALMEVPGIWDKGLDQAFIRERREHHAHELQIQKQQRLDAQPLMQRLGLADKLRSFKQGRTALLRKLGDVAAELRGGEGEAVMEEVLGEGTQEDSTQGSSGSLQVRKFVVSSYDNLGSIAVAFELSIRDLMDLNPDLDVAAELQPGDTVSVMQWVYDPLGAPTERASPKRAEWQQELGDSPLSQGEQQPPDLLLPEAAHECGFLEGMGEEKEDDEEDLLS
eukprot:TRINITY_DN7215_c0_g1_i3.p1 TRINITY_DN7215_c0_g1~~TRINITY_DN7215_c0_g1_i3.p1  ORF type:complete len:490 (-),score=131.28 TRINITY_DN7215_c0_g1_i3:148-1617(-)